MRTNSEIDDALLDQAMKAAGRSTKRATVKEGLRLLVRVHQQPGALPHLRCWGGRANWTKCQRRGGRSPEDYRPAKVTGCSKLREPPVANCTWQITFPVDPCSCRNVVRVAAPM